MIPFAVAAVGKVQIRLIERIDAQDSRSSQVLRFLQAHDANAQPASGRFVSIHIAVL